MGHVLFVVLHVLAILFGMVLLFVTVPAHIIFAAMQSRSAPAGVPTPETHVKCPDCKELVLKDANICKHCGCKLVPQPDL